jgi:hypothetical protein
LRRAGRLGVHAIKRWFFQRMLAYSGWAEKLTLFRCFRVSFKRLKGAVDSGAVSSADWRWMKYRITQRLTLMALALVALSPLGRAQAQIAGDWQGTLDAGGTQLRLALHIIAAPDGRLKATWDSIDQGANGLPINAISLKDSKLAFSVDAAHITY